MTAAKAKKHSLGADAARLAQAARGAGGALREVLRGLKELLSAELALAQASLLRSIFLFLMAAISLVAAWLALLAAGAAALILLGVRADLALLAIALAAAIAVVIFGWLGQRLLRFVRFTHTRHQLRYLSNAVDSAVHSHESAPAP